MDGTIIQATWKDELLEARRKKDRAFAGPGSPLPAHERVGFRGLPYFDPDPRFRFEVPLDDDEKPQEITIPRTGGDEVVYERVGTFRVKFPDGETTLAAYRTGNEEKAGELFIPFKDATSGKNTYGGGRYLEAHPTPDGKYIVDFNYAYHPFCVYDESYTCPIPPRENWLKVPIRAGERLAGTRE